MKILGNLTFLLTLMLAHTATHALPAENSPALQDHVAIRSAAAEFLKIQASGQPGQVNITVGQVDNRLNLPACSNLSPFLPQGSKPWGKITLGVRCPAPTPWTIYLQASVQITGDYYVTAGPISQGQVLTATDLTKVKGDLSTLPAGVITNPDQAIGKSMLVSIASGSVLRMDALKNIPAVQQGQSVRIVSSGLGFQVATDGQALSNASEGQIARAKTASGQTVSGVARAGGIIEVTY